MRRQTTWRSDILVRVAFSLCRCINDLHRLLAFNQMDWFEFDWNFKRIRWSRQVRNDEGLLCRSCNEAIDSWTLNFFIEMFFFLKLKITGWLDSCCLSNWNIQPGAQRQDDEMESENVHFDKKKNFWFLPSNRSWWSRTVERCWTVNIDEVRLHYSTIMRPADWFVFTLFVLLAGESTFHSNVSNFPLS